MEYDFNDIEWGPDEAKGDKNLQRYFVPISEYEDIYKGKYRYIIGRKGCGKTAILEKIRYEVENSSLGFAKKLTLRDFPISNFRQLRDRGLQDKSQFVPIWKFLIIIEICKMITLDNGVEEIKLKMELEDFIETNFPGKISFTDTVKILTQKKSKVTMLSKWLGAEVENNGSVESSSDIHYQKAYSVLWDKLSMISSQSTYYIFFDELDEGYKARDTGIRLLILSLLRSIEDMFIEFSDLNINFRPLLALRSDIFDGLEDNDLNKLDDYIIRLKWSSRDDEYYRLRDIVNARICASLNLEKGIDAWSLVVDDEYIDPSGKHKSLWNYMCNQTFERPRDILKYLKNCSQVKSNSKKLNFDIVNKASIKYSDWFYRELKDEISSTLPVWQEALKSITQLGYGQFDAAEIIGILKKDTKVRTWVETNNRSYEDILECLFNYGVIGNVDVNYRWLFRYKDDDLDWSASKKIIVHFGFEKKLKLRRRNINKIERK